MVGKTKKSVEWPAFARGYAKKHGITYSQALKEGRSDYYKSQGKEVPPLKPKKVKIKAGDFVTAVPESLSEKPRKQLKTKAQPFYEEYDDSDDSENEPVVTVTRGRGRPKKRIETDEVRAVKGRPKK